MSLTITHSPGKSFAMGSIFGPKVLNLDLNKEVKKHLGSRENLTNEKAVKILKEIKWKADVKAFFTKPIVLITASITGMLLATALPFASAAIPLTNVALVITKLAIDVFSIFLGMVSGGVLGFSAVTTFNGILPAISKGYSDMSAKASEYIKQIQASEEELKITLAE